MQPRRNPVQKTTYWHPSCPCFIILLLSLGIMDPYFSSNFYSTISLQRKKILNIHLDAHCWPRHWPGPCCQLSSAQVLPAPFQAGSGGDCDLLALEPSRTLPFMQVRGLLLPSKTGTSTYLVAMTTGAKPPNLVSTLARSTQSSLRRPALLASTPRSTGCPSSFPVTSWFADLQTF